MKFDEKLLVYMFNNLRVESPHRLMDMIADNIGRGGLPWYTYLIIGIVVLILFILLGVILNYNTPGKMKVMRLHKRNGKSVYRSYLV